MVSSGRRPSFLLTLLWTIPTPCHSIQPSSTIKGSEYSLHNCKRLEPSQPEPISRSRRIFLSSAASASFSMPPMGATAVESIDCLSDLPPLADNHVRIFLCRHGQTENNRLKRLYGDGSNPPLNQVGERQAELLGQALLHASTPPSVPFFHSPLKRAQQTAEIASSTLNQVPSTRLITSLREVDFGGFVEGKPAQLIRAKLTATYSAWAIGELDVRVVGHGENGRQVLDRAERSLEVLVDYAAKSPSKCIAAISHSTFLRMMLACLLDITLFQAAIIEQHNACVNVVDFNTKEEPVFRTAKSTLLGGGLSLAPPDFCLRLPAGTILRMNEKRHLQGL